MLSLLVTYIYTIYATSERDSGFTSVIFVVLNTNFKLVSYFTFIFQKATGLFSTVPLQSAFRHRTKELDSLFGQNVNWHASTKIGLCRSIAKDSGLSVRLSVKLQICKSNYFVVSIQTTSMHTPSESATFELHEGKLTRMAT
jgi:hypothetical protein